MKAVGPSTVRASSAAEAKLAHGARSGNCQDTLGQGGPGEPGAGVDLGMDAGQDAHDGCGELGIVQSGKRPATRGSDIPENQDRAWSRTTNSPRTGRLARPPLATTGGLSDEGDE